MQNKRGSAFGKKGFSSRTERARCRGFYTARCACSWGQGRAVPRRSRLGGGGVGRGRGGLPSQLTWQIAGAFIMGCGYLHARGTFERVGFFPALPHFPCLPSLRSKPPPPASVWECAVCPMGLTCAPRPGTRAESSRPFVRKPRQPVSFKSVSKRFSPRNYTLDRALIQDRSENLAGL